ncbi:hypothetical protein DC347_00330 [Pseudarthrobacter sp. AG30]|uniref:hypothetical protein n=1 Tax=unclassified Pseudarthrobacter TaxID=2647000 RepID=UPI000D651D9F|nr:MULTISPECIES: hypothetical protein [unclassified Pseudarthrobacter]RAX18558.1 hypothetical protein DC347_00330 [Pseudarthrobacter sp. AG30]
MTQTASNPGPQLTVSVPAAGAPAKPAVHVQDFDAAAGLAATLGGGPLVPQIDPEAIAAAGDAEDVLTEVWRTSSYLEGKQWELDSALEALRQAVRKASSAGVARDELCTAANLSAEELAAILLGPDAAPAAI